MNFNELYSVDCSDSIEKRSNGKTSLSYLSWVMALKEVLQRCPDMTYEIEMFQDPATGAMLPYTFDPRTGYMVFTNVTIDGVTRRMWLPVMDGANAAMTDHDYEYDVGYGDRKTKKLCKKADMFDINKTIMRCLTKNFAMFGLGLYIYAGEDLPEDLSANETITPKDVERLRVMMKPNQIEYVEQKIGHSIEVMTKKEYAVVLANLHKNDNK